MEEFPSEESVANIIFSFSGDIYGMSDALRFLNINDYDKPNMPRLICWLIGLKLLPPDRVEWMPELMKLLDYYKRCLKRYVSDCYLTPLDSVSRNKGFIRDTVHDGVDWFKKFAAAFGVSQDYYEDAETRVQRIFAVITHDANGFEFRDGYSRLAFMCYLLPLIFSSRAKLPVVFAEALAHHMTRAMCSIQAFNAKMDGLGGSENEKELYRLAKKFCSGLIKKMDAAGINFFDYSAKWERNLFTEEHSPMNILLIWDQLIFNMSKFREYLRFMMIAHYRAMIKAEIDFSSDESIYNMKWDAMAIIDDVEFLMEKDKENPMKIVYQIICPCLPFLYRY